MPNSTAVRTLKSSISTHRHQASFFLFLLNSSLGTAHNVETASYPLQLKINNLTARCWKIPEDYRPSRKSTAEQRRLQGTRPPCAACATFSFSPNQSALFYFWGSRSAAFGEWCVWAEGSRHDGILVWVWAWATWTGDGPEKCIWAKWAAKRVWIILVRLCTS